MNKNLLILITTIFFCFSNCKAQDSLEMAKYFRHVVKLMKENRVSELAHLVNYPLKRQNPLPDISSANAFIHYWPTLIDSAFKKKLAKYNDSDIFEHNSFYGLVGGPFSGDIWIDKMEKLKQLIINLKRN